MQTGFATFELSYHISYYTLRLSTQDNHSPPNIALLSSNLHEVQVSLSVVGISNNLWTSYCLVRVLDDEVDPEADESSSDSGYGDDEWGWHEYEDRSEDMLNTETTGNGANDPRKYWLESVRARMHSVVEEWRHIVCTLRTTLQPISEMPLRSVRLDFMLSIFTKVNTRPECHSEAPSRIPRPSR